MIILGPKTAILGPQFCRILVLNFGGQGGPRPPGPPGSAPAINHLGDRVHQMEKLLLGKDHTVATQQFFHSSYIGRLLFAHKLNIYLTSIQETQLRLYDELERVLKEFLSAVRILSKGYLPASLFPLTVLCRITSNA